MALENFAGPEYFTEFDPEKFIRDLKEQAKMAEANQAERIPEPASDDSSGDDNA